MTKLGMVRIILWALAALAAAGFAFLQLRPERLPDSGQSYSRSLGGPFALTAADGSKTAVPLTCRIDTLDELEYFRNGGILPYVLRSLAA